MDNKQIYKRYTDAKGTWDCWRTLYDEAYAYAIPNRDPWPTDIAPGTRKNIQVYDITACNSTRRLVSRLHTSLVPAGQQWFSLEAGDVITDPSEKAQLNLYLQAFTDIIFQALNDSNFDLVINELLQDLVIGTGGMMIYESNDSKSPIKCKAVSMDVMYPEGNAFDEINTVFRDVNNVCGRDINALWPKATITENMTRKMAMNPNTVFNFVEGVVYIEDEDVYRIVVLERESNDYILDVKSKSTPWIVARWSKNSNEVGGRGPVIDALPTIRSLNVLTEEIMRNVALSTSPPWMAASDGVFNPYLFQIEPNKIIPVSRQSMADLPLKRIDVSGDVNMGNLEVNDMRMQIKDALFDNPVRPVDSPEQTATEVMIRQQQFMEEVSPAFGRLSVELQPKIIKRVIYILQRKGQLPHDLKIDNKTIQIKYKSTLAKSAQLQKIQNLQNYVAIMQPIIGQQMTMGTINVDQLPKWVSDMIDVDEKLIKTPAQVLELIKQVMQSQTPQNPGDDVQGQNASLAQNANSQLAGTSQNG